MKEYRDESRRGRRRSRKVYSLDRIAEVFAPIADRYGISEAYVFGSYGRGEARRDSDIDIVIGKGRMKSYIELMAFETELENALRKDVTAFTFDEVRNMMDDIRDDMVLIYERRERRSPGDARDLKKRVRQGPAGPRLRDQRCIGLRRRYPWQEASLRDTGKEGKA